jgi:integrase
MRTWTTGKGEAKEAWVVNYTDQSGKRRMKTFARKKEADAWRDRTRVDVREGVHTPDAATVTVAEAAKKWLDTCRINGLERSTISSYEDNVGHLAPFIGNVKLSRLNVPTIRAFEDRLRTERDDQENHEFVGVNRRRRSGARTRRAQRMPRSPVPPQ